MTEAEREMFFVCAEGVAELSRTRDDMIVGLTAAILDLHRVLIDVGHQTKQDAINRLSVQRDELRRESPGEMGARYLQALIATLAENKLNAAQWLRQPPSGSA